VVQHSLLTILIRTFFFGKNEEVTWFQKFPRNFTLLIKSSSGLTKMYNHILIILCHLYFSFYLHRWKFIPNSWKIRHKFSAHNSFSTILQQLKQTTFSFFTTHISLFTVQNTTKHTLSLFFASTFHNISGAGRDKMFSPLLVLHINYIRFWGPWTPSTAWGHIIWLPYYISAVHAPNDLIAVTHKSPFACRACSLQMKHVASVTRNNLYVQSILGF
jgi:hypothetical protein